VRTKQYMATSHERLCLASEQVVVGHDWVLEETGSHELISLEGESRKEHGVRITGI
jgi:hypothetical protein